MAESYPSLKKISDLLVGQGRTRVFNATLRMSWIVLALHFIILSILAWQSLHNPFSVIWLILLMGSFGVYLFIPLAYWWYRILPRYQVQALAQELDRANPQAPDPFRTSLSLENHSPGTLAELEKHYSGLLNSLRLPKTRYFLARHLVLLGAAFFTLGASAMLSHQPKAFLRRVAMPWSVLQDLPRLKFKLQEMRLVLGEGDTLRITGQVQNILPKQTIFAYVNVEAHEFRVPLEVNTEGYFEFIHGPLVKKGSLQFVGDNGHSSRVFFEVLPPPFLTHIQAILKPPAYTGLRTDTLPNGIAQFSVLPGTQVTWIFESDRKLKNCSFNWYSTDSNSNLGPGQSFRYSKEVRKPLEYTLNLEDEFGIRSQQGILNRIELLPDLMPEVQLLSPEADTILNRDFKLPLVFRLKDDFGISDLRLNYRIIKDGRSRLEGEKQCGSWLKQGQGGTVEAFWDLGNLNIQPQEAIEFHLVVFDNDAINGPKSGRSEARTLRLPSMQEVLATLRQRDQSVEASLKSALQREKQLERKLEHQQQPPQEEGPPVLADYDINRIMVEDPRSHLERLSAALATLTQAPVKDFQEALKNEALKMPQGNQGFLPIEEQQKNLEELIKAQKQQENRLAGLQEKLSKQPFSKASALEKAKLERLAQELHRNLSNQEDLQKQMQDKANEIKAKSDLMDEAIQEQMKMAQDMNSAAEDIQKNMQQAAKEGMLSPDLLEKMKKVDELMREVLPDSLREMLQKKLSGQEVNQEELQKQLKQLLEKQAELAENLNRALAMLEQLKDRKRMQELKQALAELTSREAALENDLKAGKAGTTQAAEQKSIQKETQHSLADFAAQAALRQGLDEIQKKMDSRSLQKDMQEVQDALAKDASLPSKSSPSASNVHKAAKSAASAVAKLNDMQASLSEAMEGMENSVDLSEVQDLLQESMALSRLQILIRSGSAQRRAEGWEAEEAQLYGKVAQTGYWLQERVKVLAAKIPFIGSALMAAARNLAAASREASQQYTWELGEQSLKHNQNLSRELLKVLKMSQEGSGQGGGSGSGSGSASKNAGGQGEGKGQGQGQGQDLSGQLKGMSGKQMAINQATYQLLRAMLEGRQPGGQKGGQSGSSPSGASGAGSSEGLNGEANRNSSGNGGAETLPGMANAQGELGENLESLAEKLGEEGSGSQKLRGLADQARKLEDDLRQGRITPEEMRLRQERFQTRLLEAAHAMEERGQSEKREAETSKGQILPRSDFARAKEDVELIQMLRAARRAAKALSLSESQKQYLDEYYESLLTR